MASPVSIIIPCYNAGPWLAETLQSALAQTWPEKEVILVDDGSTDKSPEIACSFERRGVRVLRQSNRGAAAARNAGLAVARGDWIQFLDADDLLAPDKIARQMELSRTTGDAFALCSSWVRFRDTQDPTRQTDEPLCADRNPIDWLTIKFSQHAMMHPAAWLVPRAIASRAGLWNETLSLDDDGEYFCRVVLASQGVRCCRETFSFYRSDLKGSLSRRRSAPSWESAWRSLNLSTQRLLALENSERTRKACATAFQRFIYDSFPVVPKLEAQAAARVAALGGSDLPPPMGPKSLAFARLVGWRNVWRLKSWLAR